MKSNFRNLLIIILSLVLFGVLSGCSWFGDKKKTGNKRFDHYEPIVLSSDEATIKVKFLDVNSYAQPVQALELISEHCHGSYTETDRLSITGWTTIEAECS